MGSRNQWRRCRVVQVSRSGAILELDGLISSERLRGTLYLELASSAPGEGIRLSGKVRHQHRAANGRVRVGVDFAPLLCVEDLVDLLLRLKQR
jgi:hypothetical protein